MRDGKISPKQVKKKDFKSNLNEIKRIETEPNDQKKCIVQI